MEDCAQAMMSVSAPRCLADLMSQPVSPKDDEVELGSEDTESTDEDVRPRQPPLQLLLHHHRRFPFPLLVLSLQHRRGSGPTERQAACATDAAVTVMCESAVSVAGAKLIGR